MKKITILSLILLGLGSSPLLVKADVIPPNSHSLERCAKVVNLDKFPDVVLVGYYIGPMIDKYEAYQIQNNECLTKGYKFNTFSVYWTTKENFNSLDLKNLELEKGKDINHGSWIEGGQYTPVKLSVLLNKLEVSGGYVNDSNPLVKETIKYYLIKTITGYELQQGETISEYNNGELPTIITVDPVEDHIYYKITKKLKVGIKNDNEVKYLQQVLNRTIMSSLVEDGSFGQKTKIAVIKFQKAYNLSADGVVGAKTMAVINSL